MRRISFSRPKEKVRGAARRLKMLDKWANGFDGYFPTEWSKERYVEFRLPVLDRLVDPPTTQPEWQLQAIQAVFRVMDNLNNARHKEFSSVPINLILTWPKLSGSRIILFFDCSYYKSFYEKDDEWQKTIPKVVGLSRLPFLPPNNLSVKSIKFMNRNEGMSSWYEEDWYVYSYKSIE